MKRLKCFLPALLLCSCLSALAQDDDRRFYEDRQRTNPERPKTTTQAVSDNPNPHNVWKKRVIRMINIMDSTDYENRRLHIDNSDSSLSMLFTYAVLRGRIDAYSNFDTYFNTKLTRSEVADMISPKVDTVQAYDPVNDTKVNRIIKSEVKFDAITRYKVLEQWTYDRTTGKTSIQTLGIAPVKDVYGDNGELRGRIAMYWLKFADIKGILEKYEEEHPKNNIAIGIWEDYFSDMDMKNK